MVQIHTKVDNINVKIDENGEKLYKCNKKCGQFLHFCHFPKNSLGCYECKREYNKVYMRLKRIAEAEHNFSKKGYKVLIQDNVDKQRQILDLTSSHKTMLEQKEQEFKRVLEQKDVECRVMLEQKEVEFKRVLEQKEVEFKRVLEQKEVEFNQVLEQKDVECRTMLEQKDLEQKEIQNNLNTVVENERIISELKEKMASLDVRTKISQQENKVLRYKLKLVEEKEKYVNDELQKLNDERVRANLNFMALKYPQGCVNGLEEAAAAQLSEVLLIDKLKNMNKVRQERDTLMLYAMEHVENAENAEEESYTSSSTSEEKKEKKEGEEIIRRALELNDNLIFMLNQTRDLDSVSVEKNCIREQIKDIKNMPEPCITENDKSFINDIIKGKYRKKVERNLSSLLKDYNTQSFLFAALYDKCTYEERNRADAFLLKYKLRLGDAEASLVETVMEERKLSEHKQRILDRKLEACENWRNEKANWENVMMDTFMLYEGINPKNDEPVYVLYNREDKIKMSYKFELEPLFRREDMRHAKPIVNFANLPLKLVRNV
jgi:hypothetical protein